MSDIDSTPLSPPITPFLNRPQFSPLGPRSRWGNSKTSTVPMDASGSATAQDTFRVMGPTTTSVKPLPTPPNPIPPVSFSPLQSPVSTISFLDSPPYPDDSGVDQSMELASRPTSLTLSEHSTYTPSMNEEEPLSPMASPAYHYNNYVPDVETSSRPPALVSKSSMLQAPPKLTPPQPISFESVPVPWKGMPLEPALWTFSSTELQDIVSRAIRLSAKESFLRLLTVENLDKILPAELERLGELKTITQTRYRFLVQRRTMLFHAMNTSSIASKKGDENETLVSQLTAQLAETVMDCDQRLEELHRINDQIAQVNKLLDVHASSALAVALRKLNTSYAHRTKDLNKARQRIFQLEAELEDAWKEAEKFASELDEYEASGADDAVIEKAEIVALTSSPSQSPPPLITIDRRGSLPIPMAPTLLEVKTITPVSPILSNACHHRSASASFVDMKISPPVPKNQPNDDVASIRSSKSVKSVKSAKSAKGYASSVHAAKKRSSRTSQSSLRLSIGGPNPGKASSEAPPPMPVIPLHFANAAHITGAKNSGRLNNQPGNMSPTSSSTASHFFYATGSRLTQGSNGSLLLRGVKKQASLDTLSENERRSAPIDAYRGRAADDIYVERYSHFSALRSSKSPYTSGNVDLVWEDDGEIQAIPRTPPYRCRSFSSAMDNRRSQYIQRGDIPPVPPPKDSRQTLPSVWKNVEPVKNSYSRPQTLLTPDSPLPPLPELGVLPHSVLSQDAAAGPSTHKPGLLRHSKTLHKIKGFTKRYSASIPPIFNGKHSLRKNV